MNITPDVQKFYPGVKVAVMGYSSVKVFTIIAVTNDVYYLESSHEDKLMTKDELEASKCVIIPPEKTLLKRIGSFLSWSR